MAKAVPPRGRSGPPISGSFTVERLLCSEPLQIPMVNAQLNGFANCSSCGARISGSTMGRDQSRSNRWDVDELRWSSLMSDAQSGDRRAYEMLLSELGDAIEDYVRSRFGAIDVLEDCVQESLLALHRSRHTYDPRKPFRPWLFTVVRHRCIDVLRRTPLSYTGYDTERLRPADTDLSSQLDSASLLGRLAPKEREAVTLTKLEGYSMAEAGRRCGVSEGAMKVRVHRALRSLKELLEREGSPT